MKRKIALILAMLTVCSFASCGSDKEDDNKPFDLKNSESSSDDSDESSEVDGDEHENELSKLEAEEKEAEESAMKEAEKKALEAEKAAREQEEAEAKIKEQEEAEKKAKEQEELIKKEQEQIEEEISSLESEAENSVSEADESSSAENEDGAFSMGTVNGKVYSSDFSGVTFNLPDNMVFADNDEIMSLMDISGEVLGDKAAALMEISKKATIYDMLARDVVSGDNIQVMYENLSLYGQSVADAYDIDMYLQAVTKQFAALESSGIKVTQKGKSDIKLGGQDFTKVELETYYETYDFTATQAYYIKKIDDYMLSIVITLGVDSTADGLETYESLFE